MGIYDRDWAAVGPKSPSGLGAIRVRSFNTWLIIVNVAVFVIDAILAATGVLVPVNLGADYRDGVTQAQIADGRAITISAAKPTRGMTANPIIDTRGRSLPAAPQQIRFLNANGVDLVMVDGELYPIIGQQKIWRMAPVEAFLHFSTYHFFRLEVWRLIGFQFVHANITHLLFNMIGLYFFGSLVEGYLGPKRYLAFYLICGIFGAVAYLTLNLLGNLLPYHIPGLLFHALETPLVGASAGVFGVLMAAAFVAPTASVYLFFVLPMRLATMAYLLTLFAAWVVITGGQNAGGQAAHLGGAAAGYYFIRHTHLLRDFFEVLGPSRKGDGARPRRPFGPRPPSPDEVDRILDKVHAHGLHTLTETERRALRQSTESKQKK